MIRGSPGEKDKINKAKKEKPNLREYRHILFSAFVYVSLDWPAFLQRRPSGKMISHLGFQIGSKELLSFSSGPFFSSQIADPPRGNIGIVIKSVTPALQSSRSGPLGLSRLQTHTRKYKQDLIWAPATTSGARATHVLLSLHLMNAASLEAADPSKCHWESKVGVFFT